MQKSIKRGQVWFYKPTSTPAGSIQRGPRPVIIVSNEVLNRTSSVVLAVPCTTKIKRNFPTHALFIMFNRVNVALAEHLMPVNVSELTHLEYTLEDFTMKQVDQAIMSALALDSATSVEVHKPSLVSASPVDKSVDIVDKKPVGNQAAKFYNRYPQLAPKRPKYRRWTDEEAAQLVKDFKSIAGRDVIEKKYGLPYETLRKYYYRFKDKETKG